MAKIEIDGIDVRYMIYGDKGRDVILLHGWGQNIEMMAYIAAFLKDHFKVYVMDLPGFGQSQTPPYAYGIPEYSLWLRHFCDHFMISDPIIIAHSFGARIAFEYAYHYPVHRMCLTGAAGLRPRRGLMWYIKTYTYKLGKKILSLGPFKVYLKKLQDNMGSEDYKNASGVMREILVKTVNYDVRELLGGIKTETLLVFGEKDEATPLWMGKEIERLMPDCALVIFEGDDHYAYFHQAQRFNLVLDAFLKRDYTNDDDR